MPETTIHIDPDQAERNEQSQSPNSSWSTWFKMGLVAAGTVAGALVLGAAAAAIFKSGQSTALSGSIFGENAGQLPLENPLPNLNLVTTGLEELKEKMREFESFKGLEEYPPVSSIEEEENDEGLEGLAELFQTEESPISNWEGAEVDKVEEPIQSPPFQQSLMYQS